MLKTDGVRKLYQVAKDLPIVDFHNHQSVVDMAKDRKFDNLTQLWVTADPYKHRMMRICGVEEKYITGDATDFEKFEKYCEVFPLLAGNPVYDWSLMELHQVFGIDIQFKSLGLHHCQHRLAGFLTDIGVTVQHPGYSSQRIAGFSCQIFDGHRLNPSRRRQQHP